MGSSNGSIVTGGNLVERASRKTRLNVSLSLPYVGVSTSTTVAPTPSLRDGVAEGSDRLGLHLPGDLHACATPGNVN